MEKIKNKTLKTIAIFIIKFNLLAIPLWILIYLNFSLPGLQIFLASAIQNSLKIFGIETIRDGYFLGLMANSNIRTIEINMDCTGWKSAYALFALAIATPVASNKKFKFLIIALPSIFLINFFRVLSTIFIAYRFGFQHLEIVHTILWREGLILAVVLIWYLWLRKEKYNIKQKQAIFR